MKNATHLIEHIRASAPTHADATGPSMAEVERHIFVALRNLNQCCRMLADLEDALTSEDDARAWTALQIMATTHGASGAVQSRVNEMVGHLTAAAAFAMAVIR